jgi:hypothetical protein
MARSGPPFRIDVAQASAEGMSTGLHCDSVIMADNLATALDMEIDRIIGQYPSISAIDNALKSALGL